MSNKRQLTTTSTDERSRYIKEPAEGKVIYFLNLEKMRVLNGKWHGHSWWQQEMLKQKRVYHIRRQATEDLKKVEEVLDAKQ